MSCRSTIFLSRTFPDAGRVLLESEFDIREWPGQDGFITRETLLEGVVGADAIIIHISNKVEKSLLDAAGEILQILLYIIILRVSFCSDIWYCNILAYYLGNILAYYLDN